MIWNGGSSEPPQITAQFSKIDKNLVNKKDKIIIEKQFVEDIPVENSYIKKIADKNGKVKFINATYVETFSDGLKKSVQEIKKTSAIEWLSKFYIAKPDLKYKKLVGLPQFSVSKYKNKLIPVVKFNILINSEKIESFVFDGEMNLIDDTFVGSHFQTAKATAYPQGPKLSVLSSVLLKSLINDQILKTDQIQVTSESTFKVNLDEALNYTPPDERFDQVQVFYYIQQALSWFESNLDIEAGRLQVNAITHLGYPDKTNAAFFYNGIIRLGSGDGDSYSHIPLDPSIVIHESSHALIEMLASLPYQNDGGSLNEGFADFFTTIQLNNPKLGEVAYKKGPFKRQVDVLVPLKEKNGGLYHDSAIVSSFFWKLKEKIGAPKAILVGVNVLKKLAPDSDFELFQNLLLKTLTEDLSDDDLKEALNLYKIWSD